MQTVQQQLVVVSSRASEAEKDLASSRAESEVLCQQVTRITAEKDELARLYSALLDRLPVPRDID